MNVKKKGNAGENNFANWMQANGIKMYRNSSSGAGMQKGDINNNLDMTIEIKTVKKINLQDAWYQVNRDASVAKNTPVLAIHYDGMRKDTWLIVMHSEDWLYNLQQLSTKNEK
jgi:Holliday junction resolvase